MFRRLFNVSKESSVPLCIFCSPEPLENIGSHGKLQTSPLQTFVADTKSEPAALPPDSDGMCC
jgi:hypothetical protein